MADQPIAPQTVPVFVIRSPQYRIIYSNTFAIRATPVDMALTFSVQSTLPAPTVGGMQMVNATQEEVMIMLTLPSLKALAEHLAGVIEITEKELGPIRVTKASRLTEEHRAMIRQNIAQNPISED